MATKKIKRKKTRTPHKRKRTKKKPKNKSVVVKLKDYTRLQKHGKISENYGDVICRALDALEREIRREQIKRKTKPKTKKVK